MGYLTRYRIELAGAPGAIERLLAENTQVDHGYVAFNDLVQRPLQVERFKWYANQTEVAAISARHPEVLVTVHGEGEDAGDLWRKYFKRGLVQVARAEIVYDPFDEGCLEPVEEER